MKIHIFTASPSRTRKHRFYLGTPTFVSIPKKEYNIFLEDMESIVKKYYGKEGASSKTN